MKKRARPKLGQHFLRATAFQQRIADAITLRPDDLVVEIGPGGGAMTELLAARVRRVVAIEIDLAWVEKLRAKLSAHPKIEIIQGDILATDLAALCRQHEAAKCFVFGNLPYYITSPILHHLFRFASNLRGMALLVQREVAERLVAQPGRREYGYLSVATQLHACPRIVLRVPAGAFSPPPKVESALVDFQMLPATLGGAPVPSNEFLEFVKRCFAQKRKNLVNNLKGVYPSCGIGEGLAELGLGHSARAEELSVSQLATLFGRLAGA